MDRCDRISWKDYYRNNFNKYVFLKVISCASLYSFAWHTLCLTSSCKIRKSPLHAAYDTVVQEHAHIVFTNECGQIFMYIHAFVVLLFVVNFVSKNDNALMISTIFVGHEDSALYTRNGMDAEVGLAVGLTVGLIALLGFVLLLGFGVCYRSIFQIFFLTKLS